jgi:hypothetical protein
VHLGRLSLVLGLLWCAGPAARPALAQEASSTLPLARVFGGVGVGLISDDASSRMAERFNLRADEPFTRVVDGGAALSRRFGVGVEYSRVSRVAADTRGSSFESRGEQHERTVIALARFRVASSRPLALDAVGGAGVLVQQHERVEISCFLGCAPRLTETLTRRVPAVMVGADVPVQLAPHFAIATTVRVHLLRRGEAVADPGTRPIPWQYELSSSSRVAAGGSARLTW